MQDFYVLDNQLSTSGCLPHGDACYLDKWDIILVRVGPHGMDLKEPLSKKSFTILAHELGHKFIHLKTNGAQMGNLSYKEQEIRAWKNAIALFGHYPKFDNNYAEAYINYYQKLE